MRIILPFLLLTFFSNLIFSQQNPKDPVGQLVNEGIQLHDAGDYNGAIKKYEEALQYYNKSLVIKVRIRGEGCIDCATTLNNIGSVYKNQGKYE